MGLLLREVGGALQESREIRQIAIQVLKGLMIKHTFDDRYVAKVSFFGCLYSSNQIITFFFFFKAHVMSLQSQQARLATLYLPLFGLLQENVCRLHIKESLMPSHNVRLTPSGDRKYSL